MKASQFLSQPKILSQHDRRECACICVHTIKSSTHVFECKPHACMYICMYTVYVCIYIYVYTYAYLCVLTYVYYMYVCVSMHTMYCGVHNIKKVHFKVIMHKVSKAVISQSIQLCSKDSEIWNEKSSEE